MHVYTIKTKEEKREIKIPSSCDEITLKQMCIFLDSIEEEKKSSQFFNSIKSFEDLKTEGDWIKYAISLSKILEKTFDIDLKDVVNFTEKNKDEELTNSLIALFYRFQKTINEYKPKIIKDFQYKGGTYLIPFTYQDVFNQKKISNVTLIEGILMFIARDTYSKAESSNMNYYNLVRTMLSIIARKKSKFWKVEELPTEHKEIEEFTKKRAKFFEDVPLSVGMDFWFFFLNS